jgi:salicylate hydroxylase
MTLNLALKEALSHAGIKVHEGWKLKDIIESEHGIEAISEDGRREEGSFLIGCNGIKAVSRSLILAKDALPDETASYTGLTQASPPSGRMVFC